ncbi:MAG: hypothetical protein JTJ28_07415 [Lactobacillus sp.]|nr:hypothetical protein [Lactobacillus sp.]
MWIRSQDRKILIEIHNLDIDDINQIWDGSSLLGKYSSEEKALKVLDEIRNELNDAQYYEIENNGHGMYTLNTGIRVYTMPDDEDVEI